MEGNRIVIIAIFLILTLSNLYCQEEVGHRIIGKVIIEKSNEPVPFAFVANSRSGLGKETNDLGIFKMNISQEDTIFFRSLGFHDTLMVVNKINYSDTLKLIVTPKNYQLGSVDVLMFKSYASFRHMVANMEMMPDESMGMNFGFTMNDLRRAEKERSGTTGLTVRFGNGGVSKAEKKYAAFLQNEKRYERYREMTSRENLKHFTKLEGAKLDSFMVFLRTKYNINPEFNEYKMMETIGMVFQQFLALNTDSGKTNCK